MNKYEATFTGRKLGAIGTFYPIRTVCEGNNEKEARSNLYSEYDSVLHLRLKLIQGEGNERIGTGTRP